MEGAGTLPSFVLDHYESTHYACDTLFDMGDREHSTIPKFDQTFSLLCMGTRKLTARRRPASVPVPLELTIAHFLRWSRDFLRAIRPSQLLLRRGKLYERRFH